MAQYPEGTVADGPNGPLIYSGGRWVSMAGQRAPVPLGAPNPKIQYEAPLAAANLERTRQDIARGPAEERKTNAEAVRAEAEAKKAQAEAGNLPDPALAQAIDALQLDDVQHAIERARQLIGKGNNTGVSGALRRMVPGSTANDLPSALSTVGGNVLLDRLKELKQASSTGASGLGALSNREGEYLRDAVAGLSIRQSDPALLDALSQIEKHINSLRAIRDGKDPRDKEVAKQYGIAVGAPNAPLGDGAGGQGGNGGGPGVSGAPMGLAPGGAPMQSVPDPTLKGVNNHVASMIAAGHNEGQIRSYLNQIRPGLGDGALNIGDWIKFNRRHPAQPIGVDLETKQVPTARVLGMDVNKAAQSPFGAYAMGAGDFLSGGTLDNLSANPALARAGMSGVSQMFPKSTLAGNISGGALAGALGEMALARAGVGATASALGGDILPNAAYGAGSADDGGRLSGAAFGGGAGLFGNLAGRAVGAGVRGTTNKAVQAASDLGIKLTPGRVLGGPFRALEDRAAGWPLLESVIKPQQRRMAEDWNRAVFRDAAPVVNDIGQAGYAALKEAEKNAYQNALGGVSLTPDPQFASDFAGAFNRGASIPTLGSDFAHVVQNSVIPQASGPAISGNQFQDALRVLRKRQSGYNKMADTAVNPLGSDVADALGDVEGAYTGLVQRQAPGVMPALNDANAMHAKKMVIAGALPATDDQLMTPLGLARSSVRNRTKFGGLDAAKSGDRPFNDLTNIGQELIPSKIPDSGTGGNLATQKLLLGGLLGGGALGGAGEGYNQGTVGGAAEGVGTGALSGLMLAGALTSPYIARGTVQRLLGSKRNPAVQNLGQFLMDSRLLGSPLALGLLPASN